MKPQKEAMLPQGIRAGPTKREIPKMTQSNSTGRSQQGSNQSEQGEQESRSSSTRARGEGRREESKEEEDDREEGRGEDIQEHGSGANTEEETKETEWYTPFGHNQGEIKENTVRFQTLNINTFPAKGSVKMTTLRGRLEDSGCIGLSELNKNHYKLDHIHGVSSNFKSWNGTTRTEIGWLKDREWESTYQQGGVSISIKDQLKEYVQEMGHDEDGLGRWAWAKLEGRDEVKTMVIQVYRPVRNLQDAGSTYNQQRDKMEEDPIHKFDKDLAQLIDTMQEEHYKLIIMGDFNQDTENDRGISKILRDKGLKNIMTERHGPGPPSHIRGSHTIDAIWTSKTIEMEQGGVEEGTSIISDHRLIWADITLDSILGEGRGKKQSMRGRRMKTTNKRAMKQFNFILQKEIKRHNLEGKAAALWKEVQRNKEMTTTQRQTFETIDTQRSRAVQHAEKKCQRFRPNSLEFSPTLNEAVCRIEVYKYIVAKMGKRTNIGPRAIINIKKRWQTDQHYVVPEDLEMAKLELRNAYINFRQEQSRAPQLRMEFMASKLKEAEEKGDETKRIELKAIIDKERNKSAHQRIKGARGKLTRGGVKFIEKTEENGTKTIIKDKDIMEKEIAQSNMDRVKQANNTDTRIGDLGEFITDADYERWEEIIQGETSFPRNMAEGTRLWLEYMSKEEYEEKEIEVTVKEYVKSWNKVKEETASAPHPLNFSTMKTMKWCRSAARLHTHMANITMATGVYPKRWEECVNSMLPKKANDWRPEKLRLTSLMMADFNHNNKIIGRKAMQWAEEKGKLASEQYGSRRNLSAAQHALNKQLLLDILRVQRRPGVIIANDAKSCYDRILHFAAYISLRRAGVPKKTIQSMLEPIRRMTHRIRTAYGDSVMQYGGEEWERDPHGILQGNGSGPAIWALVSSPILEILRKQGYGAKLYGNIHKRFFHMCGFAFVDDADIVQTGALHESTTKMIQKAQKELGLWEELLKATGGAIVPSKSDYTTINFQWNKEGEWKYEKQTRRARLTVKDDEGKLHRLANPGTSKARRTLGVWQAIDGNSKEQTKQLQKKAREWTTQIVEGSLSKTDTILGVERSLYPGLVYGLSATTMNKKQTQKVDSEVRRIFPKMGYCRSIPNKLMYGHKQYGGVGLRNIETIQGTDHIKALIDEAGTTSPTGKLMDILIEGHTLEVGRRGNILQMKYKGIKPLLTSSWIQNTMEFADTHQLQIKGNEVKLHTWTDQDSFVMDDIMTCPGATFTEDQLRAINRCRMYMHITTRSDMAEGSGRSIRQTVWECDYDTVSTSRQAYRWPAQPRPGPNSIAQWQRALGITYGVDSKHMGWLQHPGLWTAGAAKWKKWRYDIDTDSLYKQQDDGWARWTRKIQRTRSIQFEPTREILEAINEQLPIAEVDQKGNRKAFFMGYRQIQNNTGDKSTSEEDSGSSSDESEDEKQDPWVPLRQEIPQALRWVLEEVTMPDDDGEAIARAIQNNQGEFVCDGSLKDNRGTAAAISLLAEGKSNIRIRNRTRARNEEMSSYRAEACGILAAILGASLVCRRWKVQDGTVTVGCDNEAAVWNTFGKDEPTTSTSGFNLIKAARKLIRDSPLTWVGKHVKGHQDDTASMDTLDKWARANVEADIQANEYMNMTESKPTPHWHNLRLPGEGWSLYHEGLPIESKLDDYIHKWTSQRTLPAYWVQKGRISEGHTEEVQWEWYRRAVQTMPPGQRQWSTKHFSGWEGTGTKMKLWKQRDTDECPRCKEKEDSRHIIRCQDNEAEESFQQATKSLVLWIMQTSSPDMKEAIVEVCRAYRANQPAIGQAQWIQAIRNAMTNQRRLGPNSMMEGMVTHHWEQAQQVWLDYKSSNNCARRWTIQLIKKLMLVSWDMWLTRNALIHSKSKAREKLILHSLHNHMKEAHKEGRHNRFLPQLDKQTFKVPMATLLKTSEYYKRVWLRHARRTLRKDEMRMQSTQEIAVMRRWLLQVPINTRQEEICEPTHAPQQEEPQPERDRGDFTG